MTQLNDGAVGAGISPGVGAGLASFAAALVDARAQRDARRIVARTDLAFQATVRAMAAAVGASNRDGLRGTVWSSWTTALAATQTAFGAGTRSRDDDGRRASIATYMAQIARRDAQLRTLNDLRASLLALGSAHAALAASQPHAIAPLLDAVVARAARARALYDTL